MEQTDRELLIRIDERQKAMLDKLETHITETKDEMKDLKKDVKAINRWRYGVVGSWIVAVGSWIKGGM